jgi:methanethiol oxidase
MIEDGVVPDLLLGRKYGHRLHFWDMNSRRHLQTVDLGDQHQMVLELRPAHDPARTYGFVGVVVSVEDLSASIWLWHEQDGQWAADKVISIPAEPAPAEKLPPALQPFGAVPPADLRPGPVGGRQAPVRVLLGYWRTEAVRRLRPVPSA